MSRLRRQWQPQNGNVAMVKPKDHEGRSIGEKDQGLGFLKKRSIGKMVRQVGKGLIGRDGQVGSGGKGVGGQLGGGGQDGRLIIVVKEVGEFFLNAKLPQGTRTLRLDFIPSKKFQNGIFWMVHQWVLCHLGLDKRTYNLYHVQIAYTMIQCLLDCMPCCFQVDHPSIILITWLQHGFCVIGQLFE